MPALDDFDDDDVKPITERFNFTVTVCMDDESNLLAINVRCLLCTERVLFNPHELWQHACKHPKTEA